LSLHYALPISSTTTAVRSVPSIAYWATFSPTGPPPSTTTSAVRSVGSVGAVGSAVGAEGSWSAMSGTVRRGRLHVTGADRTTRQPRAAAVRRRGPTRFLTYVWAERRMGVHLTWRTGFWWPPAPVRVAGPGPGGRPPRPRVAAHPGPDVRTGSG